MRFVLCKAGELGPFLPGLQALEGDIRYPLTKDSTETFVIRHGDAYHPFFSDMGEPRFALAVEGDAVLGVVTVVLRRAQAGGHVVRAAYVCDLKVAPSARGKNVARDLFVRGLWLARREPRLFRWSMAYGVAMRGHKGDVMRSARRLHPARLGGAIATLRIYFVPQPTLAAVDLRHAPGAPDASRVLDLSPDARLAPVSTLGKKDLLVGPSRTPMPLEHLGAGPSKWPHGFGAYLQAAARAAAADRTLCFALDERSVAEAAWLDTLGIRTDSRATVYAMRLPFPPIRFERVHIATSEI